MSLKRVNQGGCACSLSYQSEKLKQLYTSRNTSALKCKRLVSLPKHPCKTSASSVFWASLISWKEAWWIWGFINNLKLNFTSSCSSMNHWWFFLLYVKVTLVHHAWSSSTSQNSFVWELTTESEEIPRLSDNIHADLEYGCNPVFFRGRAGEKENEREAERLLQIICIISLACSQRECVYCILRVCPFLLPPYQGNYISFCSTMKGGITGLQFYCLPMDAWST